MQSPNISKPLEKCDISEATEKT